MGTCISIRCPDPPRDEGPGMRRISKAATLAVGLVLAIKFPSLAADGPDLAGSLRATLANTSLSIDDRARRALEGATSIDQFAQESADPAARRKLWGQATGLLDEFLAKNPIVASAPLIRFQAGVYRWAEGRSFAEQFALSPADVQARAGAVQALDDAIARLRAVGLKPLDPADPLAQNVRFRLAQAIADRSKLEPENDVTRLASEREALGMLDSSLNAPGLRAFVRLLRAELANRLRLYVQARCGGPREAGETIDSAPAQRSAGGESRRDDRARALCRCPVAGRVFEDQRRPEAAPEAPDRSGATSRSDTRSGADGDRRRGLPDRTTDGGVRASGGAPRLDGTGPVGGRARRGRPPRMVGPPGRGAPPAR